MDAYAFLQHYWWFLVSLLGSILVFLLFVQGANAIIFAAGKTDEERDLLINSTGRKWEFTYTTLVTFGGAFFASFPLFYSTSFGGAYWVWVLILISFVFQAVSYEFHSKLGNILGKNTFRGFLVANGILGPVLLGTAVATFFSGSQFIVNKDAIGENLSPVISAWMSPWHGLEAVANPWNVCLGAAVFFLAVMLGIQYLLNNVNDETVETRLRKLLLPSTGLFLVLFLAFLAHLLLTEGFAVDSQGVVSMEKSKYLHNFIQMPAVLCLFLLGVVLVLYGTLKTLLCKTFRKGIWFSGFGTVMTVLALFLVAGYNGTAYYPSTYDLQSSLTISNSCSSLFTLKVMAIVSIIIPFVLAYIFYAWRSMDKKKLTKEEILSSEDRY